VGDESQDPLHANDILVFCEYRRVPHRVSAPYAEFGSVVDWRPDRISAADTIHSSVRRMGIGRDHYAAAGYPYGKLFSVDYFVDYLQ